MTDRQRVFLHVGCGTPRPVPRVFRGWRELRLDIDPAAAPDIVASMTDMGMVADASVDAVYSCHNLEHVCPHEVPVALGEFRRVLRPDGWLLLIVPDLQVAAELVAQDRPDDVLYQSEAGPITALDTIFGYHKFLELGGAFMAHKTGFTASTLGRAIIAAGFAKAVVQRHNFTLWAYGLRSEASPVPDPNPAVAGILDTGRQDFAFYQWSSRAPIG